jgi:hypothetical protein
MDHLSTLVRTAIPERSRIRPHFISCRKLTCSVKLLIYSHDDTILDNQSDNFITTVFIPE